MVHLFSSLHSGIGCTILFYARRKVSEVRLAFFERMFRFGFGVLG